MIKGSINQKGNVIIKALLPNNWISQYIKQKLVELKKIKEKIWIDQTNSVNKFVI